MKRTTIGVYWPARREELGDCVSRLSKHFVALSQTSPHLGAWYAKGWQRPEASEPLTVLSPDTLQMLLLQGQNRADQSREMLPELGFAVSLWNGDSGGWSASTSVTCGLYSPTKGLSNHALLNVDVDVDVAKPISPEDSVGLLKRLIQSWEPTEGYVFQLREGAAQDEDDLPELERVAYATYLTAEAKGQRSSPTGVPAPFGSGTLWIDESVRSDFEDAGCRAR